jgi:hypothetical protein
MFRLNIVMNVFIFVLFSLIITLVVLSIYILSYTIKIKQDIYLLYYLNELYRNESRITMD